MTLSRDEIVLLVSRVLAVMYAITALLDVTYVPEYLVSLHHYSGGPGASYLESIHRVYVGALLFRIVGLSILAWLFWRCGPWIARILFPARETQPQSATSAD